MEIDIPSLMVIVFIGFMVGIVFCIVIKMPKFEQYDDCISQTQNQDYCFTKFIERR